MANEGHEQITIQKHAFKVPLRYTAGHTLTEGEAGALNQVLHENLRNNFAKRVTDGIKAGRTIPELQAQLDSYAAEYVFGVRSGTPRHRGDPVMAVAMNMARAVVRTQIQKNNLPEAAWPATRVSAAAKAIIESQGPDGKILATARQQIEAERAAARDALAAVNELLNDATEQQAAQ